MSIQLSPPTLTFTRPLAPGPIIPLTIRNTADTHIAFKLKTTAPNSYTLRPNYALAVDTGGQVEVWIRRNPQSGAEPETCNDKFIAQVVALTKDEVERIGSEGRSDKFWESVSKDRIVEHTLPCAYGPPPALVSNLARNTVTFDTMGIQLSPPAQLVFPRPLASGPTVPLVIRNTADTQLAFKIKTTSPRSYTVRPNCGLVGKRVEVQIRRNPRSGAAAEPETCKDKFMVQVVVLAKDELERLGHEGGSEEVAEFWASVSKDRIVESKLRCVYGPQSSVSMGERMAMWFKQLCRPTKPAKAKEIKGGVGKDGYYKHMPQS